ncbi:hypothetical protein O181_086738 [Austropuccinia psidii MF-1]|uniref:Uncharacterized protein n=1 Tax=Austropuccinia psidii MF-1 TaxID=1389203 RepID=A0A9Q3FVL1_9BASI|nr:hypothetical protein [Austropuccinia psidii MF-1]
MIRQKGSPSPFSRPMVSSIPFNSKRPNKLPKRVNIHSQASISLQQEIPRNNKPIVNIKPKDYSLWFNGKEIEVCIERVENIVEIEGESGRDIARQISFLAKDQDISYHIEETPGYETGNWKKFKLSMNRRWGTVSPERRYKLSSITQLFRMIQKEG